MIDFGFGVTLGTIDRDMVPQLRRWRNDFRIWKTCRQNDLISERDHLNWYDRQNDDESIKMYLIYRDHCAIGVCGLTSIDQTNRRAEFSLYVDPDRHGSGLGSKTLQTLLAHAFYNLGLNSVWGETYEGNPAERLFIRVGFKKEGTRRQFYFRGGRQIDAHLYSILRSEWDGLHGAGLSSRQA